MRPDFNPELKPSDMNPPRTCELCSRPIRFEDLKKRPEGGYAMAVKRTKRDDGSEDVEAAHPECLGDAV